MTVATIQKWGNSQGIRIPKHILEEARLNSNDRVMLDVSNGQITIKKCSPLTIQELFKDYDNKPYEEEELDWGEPKGNEAW